MENKKGSETSSKSFLVGPVSGYLNKSALVPPRLVDLKKLADAASKVDPLTQPNEPSSRRLRRRLEPDLIREIVAKYESGSMTPALCTEYGLSKTGILKLLRDEGVELRRRPLTADEVAFARELYEGGRLLAAIAARLGTSYNNVRQRLLKEGIQLRPRGGSYR